MLGSALLYVVLLRLMGRLMSILMAIVDLGELECILLFSGLLGYSVALLNGLLLLSVLLLQLLKLMLLLLELLIKLRLLLILLLLLARLLKLFRLAAVLLLNMLRLEHLLASVHGGLHGGTPLSELLLDLAGIKLVEPYRSLLGNSHVAGLLSKGLGDVVE